MFFPYSTDAPVYHWPWATIGLIVANVLVPVGIILGVLPFDLETGDPWVLQYGEGLWPAQWFCSPFMHAGVFHLLGNMVALWTFGLVVEGKLGWRRYLPLYLFLAVGESAIEQTLMLGMSEGGSVGASSAIMGLLAIAAVWAPDNEFECFYWVAFVFGTVSVPILGVVVFYIGFDLLIAMLANEITGSFLHLLGVVIGFPLGVLMLRRGVVDCEGWDLFSRYGGAKKKKHESDPQAETRRSAKAAKRDTGQLEAAGEQIDAFLAEGATSAALKLHQKMSAVGDGLRLRPAQLTKLIAGLQAEQRWADLAPLMAELIERTPESADKLRVQLAQVCVTKLDRPGRALDLLGEVDAKALTEKQLTIAKRIKSRAHEMQSEGLVELDDGGW